MTGPTHAEDTAGRLAVCVGHSHTEPLAAAAAEAGVRLDILNFWHLPAPFVQEGGRLCLAPDLRARLAAPVVSLIGGAVHQDVGLAQHPRPSDFVLPGSTDLPIDPEAEILPFAAVHAAMLERTAEYLAIMTAVREATHGPMFHVESPPTYDLETVPTEDPGFAHFFGPDMTFSSPWLRFKLWRVHSQIVKAHCDRSGIVFIPHPAETVGDTGFLRPEYSGTPAHANVSYGRLVLDQLGRLLPHTESEYRQGVGMMTQSLKSRSVDTGASEAADAARAAAARGDYRAAIDHATESLEHHHDAGLLADVVRWRIKGFSSVAHAPGHETWPPSFPDPFPGERGIPVIAAEELTVEHLAGAILHHGSLHVRGLIPLDDVERMRSGLDHALTARNAFRTGEPFDPSWYSQVEVEEMTNIRPWVEECDALLTADSPRMTFSVIDAFSRSGIVDCIAGFMGERPALSVGKSTLRRVPTTAGTDWHQDGSFLGKHVRSVNVWLALSDCGVDASGLDVVARRLPYVMQTHSHGAIFDWAVGPGLIDVLVEGGAQVQSPEFRAGDALLFDHMMLHRTGIRPSMTKLRWAVESWFFAPTAYPAEQVPLLV